MKTEKTDFLTQFVRHIGQGPRSGPVIIAGIAAVVTVIIVVIMIVAAILSGRDAGLITVPPVTAQRDYPYRDLLADGATITAQSSAKALGVAGQAMAGTLKLSSTQLKQGERVARLHTCHGKNQSPSLTWSDAPRGTKSYIVLLESVGDVGGEGNQDGQGTAQEDMLLWSVYNIPANTLSLPADLPPEPLLENGIGQGVADRVANAGYIGPCVPRGKREYRLRVYALDTLPELSGGVGKEALFRAMDGHIIDMATMDLVYYYRL